MSIGNGNGSALLLIRPELSRREAEVAICVGEGSTDPEIGIRLSLGYETVRGYVKRLRDKTGLRRKSQLAVWACNNRDWLAGQVPAEKNRKRKAVAR